MPQINRIRVNNVKNNIGTQYYDDFMMRFHCRNTIYDLANGGGKSLLMQKGELSYVIDDSGTTC